MFYSLNLPDIGYIEIIALNVTLSFVALMADTGVVAKRSDRKGRGRLRHPFGSPYRAKCGG